MEEKQTQENTKHTNIRLNLDTYTKIEKLAKKDERTVSQQIRLMLNKYLEIKED